MLPLFTVPPVPSIVIFPLFTGPTTVITRTTVIFRSTVIARITVENTLSDTKFYPMMESRSIIVIMLKILQGDVKLYVINNNYYYYYC